MQNDYNILLPRSYDRQDTIDAFLPVKLTRGRHDRSLSQGSYDP